MAEKTRWGVVYSIHPGFLKVHKHWKKIRQYIEQKGVEYDFVQSEAFGSVERLVGMMCENGYKTIVIVGDDSALYDAINGIMKHKEELPSDFAFGVIPVGIGHDFARFWGITKDNYADAIDHIIEHKTRRIDVGSISYQNEGEDVKRYFLNCINIGLGARLVKITNDLLRITHSSKLSATPSFARIIFERHQFSLKLKIDTEFVEGPFMSVCIGNCQGYGQTPNAVPYNGMVDVSAITRPLWWQLFEGFWLLGKGRFLNYKNVHPYRALNVKVMDVGKALVSLDGRVLETKNLVPFTVSVEQEAINFIV